MKTERKIYIENIYSFSSGGVHSQQDDLLYALYPVYRVVPGICQALLNSSNSY